MSTLGTDYESAKADSRRHLCEALRGAFSTSYVTLVSIIQGAALSYLFTVIDSVIPDAHGRQGFVEWTLIVTAVLIIVAVWNEYVMGVTVFDWVPTLLDAAIPFAIGIVEYAFMRAIHEAAPVRSALVAFATLWTLGVAGFVNMYWRASSQRRNRFVIAALGAFPHLNSIGCAVVAVLSGLAATMAPSRTPSVFLLLMPAVLVAYLAKSAAYWNRLRVWSGATDDPRRSDAGAKNV
jgi:hypothetical protein